MYNGWRSLDQLCAAVCGMTLDQIDALTAKPEFLAWLYVMGLREQALSMITMRGSVE